MAKDTECFKEDEMSGLTSDQFGVGVFVDFGYVNDHTGLLGVSKCAQAFFHITGRRTQRSDHGSLRVPTETFL